MNESNFDIEAAKAQLLSHLSASLDRLPVDDIKKLTEVSADSVAIHLSSAIVSNKRSTLSVSSRNQIAIANMQARAFPRIQEKYNLLDGSQVTLILGISKQALSAKAKAGHVLAYTFQKRKHYPDFQFKNNKPIPEIAELVKSLGIDPQNTPEMNMLAHFLAELMDFSNPGEPSNIQPRYAFLQTEGAMAIIVRDYKNRYEMGQ